MLREAVEDLLRERHQEGSRLYPAYEDYCFGNVPGTVTGALGEPVGRRHLPSDVYDGVDSVTADEDRDVDVAVVFLVDGFGLTQWREHDDHPVISAVERTATVTPLTSVFPSETAAAITTFNTAAYPAAHGVLGWNVYDPALDASFRGLGFEWKAGADLDAAGADLDAAGADLDGTEPDDAFTVDPIYPTLRDHGVDCRHVNPLDGAYAGTTHHQYDTTAPAMIAEATADAVAAADDPAYVYVYLPQVDHSAHADGTHSAAYADIVDETWSAVADAIEAIEAVVDDQTHRSSEDVLVTFAADHGHIDTDPDRNVDLTQYDTLVDGLERYDHDGSPIYLSGSPRNVQLHVRETAVESVEDLLEAEIGAFVIDGDSVLEQDLLGDGPVSAATERRLGDLIALHPTLGMWFGDGVEPQELSLVGMHGGLHPDEMLVPFGAVRLDAIVDELPA